MKIRTILIFALLVTFIAGCSQPAPQNPTVTPVTVIPTLPLVNRSVTPSTPATPSVATQTIAPNMPATQAATLPLPTATKPLPSATVPAPTRPAPTATSVSGFPQKPEAILIQAPGIT